MIAVRFWCLSDKRHHIAIMNYKFLDYLHFAMRAIAATKSTGEVTNLQRKQELLEEAISWLVLAKKLNEERLERLGPLR